MTHSGQTSSPIWCSPAGRSTARRRAGFWRPRTPRCRTCCAPRRGCGNGIHGRRVKLCQLRNARSGLCPEDCHYCSQSAVSEAAIPRYRLDSVDELLAGSRRAVGGRRAALLHGDQRPRAERERHRPLRRRRARASKPSIPISSCACRLGLMEEEQARALKAAGIDFVNHNLNTSERFHPGRSAPRTRTPIACARSRTCAAPACRPAAAASSEWARRDEDIIDLAFALRELRGRFAAGQLPASRSTARRSRGRRELTPTRLPARALPVSAHQSRPPRSASPAAARCNLGWFQPLALYVANSIFVDGYLTTPGQAYREAHAMVPRWASRSKAREAAAADRASRSTRLTLERLAQSAQPNLGTYRPGPRAEQDEADQLDVGVGAQVVGDGRQRDAARRRGSDSRRRRC